MAKKGKWRGEHYWRYDDRDKAGYNWRNRRTGDVIGSKGVKVDKTTGKVIIYDGKHFKGIEPTRKHVYGDDIPRMKSTSAKKKYETRVKANRLSAVKKRKSHKRRLRKKVG
mgnify:CR=1 FL=1|tara:strand:+ start:485 stop:817 length:333 start_codon:yes stop_codon:yes gene_type:complete